MIAPPNRRAGALLALLLAGSGAWGAEFACGPQPGGADGASDGASSPLPLLPGLEGLALAGHDGIQWSADRWSTNAATGDTQLDGDVQLKMGERTLASDRLEYLAGSQELRLAGTVRYRDASLAVSGESGHYAGALAEFDRAQFELLQQPGRGSAERVALVAPRRVQLERVTYTTCERGNADWQLKARRITLDLDRMRGLGQGTRVEFKGVPILYLPVLSFPLSSARQSGFLFPSLGSSSNGGAMLAVPWYWNIAPNQDLTLTPRYYTRRGVGLDTEYRLLERAGSGTLTFDYLPHDGVPFQLPTGQYVHRDRDHELLEVAARLDKHWQSRLRAEHVSDTRYFEDFSDGALTASTVFLRSELELSLRNDNTRLTAQVLQHQTLDDQLAASDRPYAERPRLAGEGLWRPLRGFTLGYEAELVNFWREVVDPATAGGADVRGWRGNLRPSMAFDVTRPGYYFKPGLALDLTSYRLQDTGFDGGGQARPSSPTRTLPVLTIDSGVQLERSDARRLVTLEPRLYYVYIPYRDQSALPDFDSGLPDPNFVSLFRANRYTGLDRIGEANNLTLGLTSRLLHPGSGQRLVSATIGETLHFDSACTSPASSNGVAGQPRCVLLPGEAPDTRRRSDLILTVDVTALKNWNLRYDLAWNPGSSKTEKSVLALQYRPSGDRVINVGYRYSRPTTLTDLATLGTTSQTISNGVDQAEFSIAWPVSRHWDLYARSAYAFGCSATYLDAGRAAVAGRGCNPDVVQQGQLNLVAVHSLENFAGFQYRGSCWGLRLIARDAVSRTAGKRDQGWYLQLELNGLSSVGSGAEAFLRGAIRGYSPATSNR